jgi:hypothetical protein
LKDLPMECKWLECSASDSTGATRSSSSAAASANIKEKLSREASPASNKDK